MARLIWTWLQVLIFKARCLGWCTTTFCPEFVPSFGWQLPFQCLCYLQGVVFHGLRSPRVWYSWVQWAKGNLFCQQIDSLLPRNKNPVPHEDRALELPPLACSTLVSSRQRQRLGLMNYLAEMSLSLLNGLEGDEIRLGHLLYRHLSWDEVQSCDKKKEKNKKKTQSCMMLIKISPGPLWIFCLETDPCEIALRSSGRWKPTSMSSGFSRSAPPVTWCFLAEVWPLLTPHNFWTLAEDWPVLPHQRSWSNVFQLSRWVRWGLFLPSAFLLGTHLQNTASHLVCMLPGPLSIMFPCPSVALWALPTKAFVLKVGFSFVQRPLGQKHIMFCGFFVEKNHFMHGFSF